MKLLRKVDGKTGGTTVAGHRSLDELNSRKRKQKVYLSERVYREGAKLFDKLFPEKLELKWSVF